MPADSLAPLINLALRRGDALSVFNYSVALWEAENAVQVRWEGGGAPGAGRGVAWLRRNARRQPARASLRAQLCRLAARLRH